MSLTHSLATATQAGGLRLSAPVDVVHICTPNPSHGPYAVELMRAGTHVVYEKPLGADIAEAAYAVRIAGETGV